MTATVGNYEEQPATMYAQSLFADSSSQKVFPLGKFRDTDDGRTFVYCLNGAVDLAAGLLIKPPTAADTHTAIVGLSTDYPAETEKIINVTGTATANQFQDGRLVIASGTGIGESYMIRGNTVTDSDGNFVIYLYDALDTTWDSTSVVWLFQNPFNGVLVNTTATTSKVLGCPQRIVTASYYFWAQVRGWGALICDVNAAGGAELDEIDIIASPNHDGKGYIVGSPAAGTNYFGQPVIARRLGVEDVTDDYATLVSFCIF